MKSNLPIKEIHGTPFYVDVQQAALKQVGNSHNVIDFNSMTDKGSHYEFFYDLDTKNMPGPFQEVKSRVVKVEIEQLTSLNPEGMAQKFGKTVAEVTGKSDYEVIVNPELVKARQENKLPVLDINKDEYFIDINEQKLTAVNNPDHKLYFSGLTLSKRHSGYEGFYHIRRQQFVAIDSDLKAYPADVVFVEIPHDLSALDPVEHSVALLDEEVQPFLRSYPPREKFVATVTDLKHSYLAAVIHENIRLSVLPKYPLYGTTFIVDIANQQLVEEKNPSNTITFTSMSDRKTYYHLNYDMVLKNRSQGYLNDSDRHLMVTLPQMKDLDPVRMANKYGLAIDELRSKSDFEIIVNQDLLRRRKKELPVVEIAGTDFQVNIFKHDFKNLKRPDIDVNAKALDFDPDFEVLSGLYNTRTMKFEKYDNDLMFWPRDTVFVKLPLFAELDPVRLARHFPDEMNLYLRLYPLQEKYQAKILPRNDSPLQKIIDRNFRIRKEAAELRNLYRKKKPAQKMA